MILICRQSLLRYEWVEGRRRGEIDEKSFPVPFFLDHPKAKKSDRLFLLFSHFFLIFSPVESRLWSHLTAHIHEGKVVQTFF